MTEDKKLFEKISDRIKELFPEKVFNIKLRGQRPHLIMAAAGLILIYSFFTGATGFIRIAKLHMEKSRLIEENRQLTAELVDSEITKKRLVKDKNFIEYIARTRHYLSRPGEIIYRFKE